MFHPFFHDPDVHRDLLEHVQSLKCRKSYGFWCCCDIIHQRCNIQLLGRFLDYCRILQHHLVPLTLTSTFNLAVFKLNWYVLLMIVLQLSLLHSLKPHQSNLGCFICQHTIKEHGLPSLHRRQCNYRVVAKASKRGGAPPSFTARPPSAPLHSSKSLGFNMYAVIACYQNSLKTHSSLHKANQTSLLNCCLLNTISGRKGYRCWFNIIQNICIDDVIMM